MAAIPISRVIWGPLSGWLLDAFTGVAVLAGWQWLFFVEGLKRIKKPVLCHSAPMTENPDAFRGYLMPILNELGQRLPKS
jgi:hypothetical protein